MVRKTAVSMSPPPVMLMMHSSIPRAAKAPCSCSAMGTSVFRPEPHRAEDALGGGVGAAAGRGGGRGKRSLVRRARGVHAVHLATISHR